MLKYALLLVLGLLVNEAQCNFAVGNIAESKNLGFSAVNVSCGDHSCVACFVTSFFKLPVAYTFEYSLNPYRVEFTADGGDYFWRFDFTQGDPSQSFRHCAEILTRIGSYDGDPNGVAVDWRGDLCFDNDMSGITVPPDCPNPLLVVTTEGHLQDERVRGLQALFCKPA
ncbi:uncharacterized protein LOC119735625 [Patiria miniata]|uniref:Uncharacterized protein n=1 Tax=Patiria miniata TaxID=46514 RepID=A0A914ANL6_PATMI|nr:uncharacterized protein LOC119735625 [Patiria miniata]